MFKLKNRNQSLVFYTLTLCLLLVVISSCSKDTHVHPDLVTGEQLFNYHCSGCHRETGKGKFLKGIPPNRNTVLSSALIVHKIAGNNGEKMKMPYFPKMSEAEAVAIVSYLKLEL